MTDMDEQIEISFEVPTDDDGFLRRECPNCELEFKWYAHAQGDPDAEVVDQYFCPLCGQASGLDTWLTTEQVEYAQRSAGPALDDLVKSTMADAFKGLKGIKYKPNPSFTLDVPTPEPLTEPNDMVIVEPPCHPHEPVKIPEEATARVHCLICGTVFAT